MRLVPAPGHAAVFAGFKPALIARLVEVRSSLDHGFGRLDDAAARAQLEQLFDHQLDLLSTGDPTQLRGFLRTYRAVRAADGLGPENLLHAVIAVGDVTQQVLAKEQPPGARTAELASAWARVSWTTARAVVEIIAEELAGRTAQLRELEP
jgi:hypothetical protein